MRDTVFINVRNKSGYPIEYATDGSIGFDLRSICRTERWIEPGRRWKFNTGVSLELPDGYGAFVQPRSGMGLHHGILAFTGVIDRDFRGEIGVVLVNLSPDAYKIMPGDRIAQLVIVRVAHAVVHEVTELGVTERGASGFGSTGR